ncbi:DUF4279 domain-containing protein [Sphingopyxis sp. KK2]|uniref:DUF4279 domain-containing protein n=1 Tax=Sphingopyxis sp. KK2 TaxID=1855727 RepID=UPI0015C3FE1C|nr:DUF4279 domain-containing protein [Sphingopyxis sp. KK2]
MIEEDDLVPSEITSLLGVEPHLAVIKGERFLSSNGKYIEASTGKWQFWGDWKSPVDLNEEISTLLAMLTDDLAAWSYLTARCHCYLTVGGHFNDWTGGIALAPETISALAARGLAIDFDLYAPAASVDDS